MRIIEYFRNFNRNDDLVKKTIMNIFLCDYRSEFWSECISIFKSLDLPTSVEISGVNYRGLSYQVLLDSSLEDSKILANDIITKFPETPLVVISEVMVQMKSVSIGEWQDDDLVGPGRYFDKLVRDGESGLFLYSE